MYQATGNTRILREQYPSMKKWTDYVITQAGESHLWNTGFQFGEWLIPSLSKSGYNFIKVAQGIKVSLQYTAPIFGYVAVCRMAETAEALSNSKEAQYYSDIASKMKSAIQRKVYSKSGTVPIDLMGAYVLGLYFDLVPDEARQVYIDNLVEMIHANGDKLDTGFLGTPYLLDPLCKSEQRDLAYTLLYQDDCPSWVYQLRNGATTIWESWYDVGEDGNPLGISYNHYALGCVMDWILREIVGLQCMEAGYKRFLVRPRPDDSLSYARHTFKSEYGLIAVDWERRSTDYALTLEVPCNITAVAILPNGDTHEVGSGSYCFTANNPKC